MKSPKKRTAAKKLKQAINAADQDNTVVIGSGYGAMGSTMSSYSISGTGYDTITLDPSTWSTGSITVPTTNYTLASGATGTGIWTTSNPTTVHIDGSGLTMKEGADIKIGEKSLTEAIEKIEERLGILKPNPGLEDRWEQLKELRKQYMELEKDLLEKEKIMKILKET